MLSRIVRARNVVVFNQLRFFGPKSKGASKAAKPPKKAVPQK